MTSFYLERNHLDELLSQLIGQGINYGLGAKAKLDAEPSSIKKIDCSGFLRYFIYHATDKQIKMPDGSWHQNQWCKNNQLEKVPYSEAALSDGWMRLGYFPKSGNMVAGHIWLILNGRTIESHGGKGPNRRAWDTAVLKNNVKKCYKLAQTYTLDVGPITFEPVSAGHAGY